MGNPKVIILLLILQVFVFSSDAQEVAISQYHVHVDTSSQLILINQDLAVLNDNYSELKTAIIVVDQRYDLVTPVLEFEKKIAYSVVDSENNSYLLYFTELPVINIQTSDTIRDEPRVHALLTLSEANGQLVNQDIGIEYRGGSTQFLPKKSLRIECWTDSLGTDKVNRTLLGMRHDDDWNLDASFYEPLRFRSKIGFELWRNLDTLYYQNIEPEATNGIRQAYTEVFINGAYQGIYLLGERVDRKQLQLRKQADNKIRGELYRGVDIGASTFTNIPNYSNHTPYWGGFEYEYPSDSIEWSSLYDFVEFVVTSDSADFYQNHQSYIALDNAVNYFIFLNLLRAYDNTGKNIFLAKYDLEQPYFYVPWDLNGSFGMNWDGTQGPFYEGILSNGLYDQLMEDTQPGGFLERLKTRWTALRNTHIKVDSLLHSFNEQYRYLSDNGVYEREAMAWEVYDFPGEAHLVELESWIENRIRYLDGFFYNPHLLTNLGLAPAQTQTVNIYPNPAKQDLYLEVSHINCLTKEVLVLDAAGQLVQVIQLVPNRQKFKVSHLRPGVYYLGFEFCNGEKKVKRLVIKP